MKRLLYAFLTTILVVGMTVTLASCRLSFGNKTCEHEWGEWETRDEPTCIDKGYSVRDCLKCDDYGIKEIPATGHTEQTITGYAATCTADGLTYGVKCSTCGEILTAQVTIPATGHTGEWGCTVCGAYLGDGAGHIDSSIALVGVFDADTGVEYTSSNITLSATGLKNIIYVYNKKPKGGYLKIDETVNGEVVSRAVNGTLGGYSDAYGGYVVRYSLSLDISLTEAKSYICNGYYVDGDNDAEAMGSAYTLNQPPVFLGISTDGQLSNYFTAIVKSGEPTELTVFMNAHYSWLNITLTTAREGVPDAVLQPVSAEYDTELGCYAVKLAVPALTYISGNTNVYMLEADISEDGSVVQKFRIQIKNPNLIIDQDGWLPAN